jgi:Na+-transporting NADH:ubiquinone oxidoreductase subunit A
METITIRRGLDIPLAGEPTQQVEPRPIISEVGLVGSDYSGLKPSLLVQEGDRVVLGQPLFAEKNNAGIFFTAPACGTVTAIRRGEKRAFQALVIQVEGESAVEFSEASRPIEQQTPESLRLLLQRSGLWCAFRTRPFGRIPKADANPASVFVTALDTDPLAADPQLIIRRRHEAFRIGLAALRRMLAVPIHLCARPDFVLDGPALDGILLWGFAGPHPAGLPSTHIHHIDPVHTGKQVWHLDAQEVIAIGRLCTTGRLDPDRIIALGGPGVRQPRLLTTRQGASLAQLCEGELGEPGPWRILSGSVLDGRPQDAATGFLGRYHRQVAVIGEGDGRSLFGWLAPGRDRFSRTGLFVSRLFPRRRLPLVTALWGGRRAIYPLGVYEKVMPLDIVATPLLKSLAVGDTEKAIELGCLELIEEDLALCSFVCPGKNEFGPMLRGVLTAIEQGG